MRLPCGSIIIAIAMISVPARADDVEPPVEIIGQRIRELYEKKDYEGVRRELLKAYELTPVPALLFALGQIEYNLRNWQSAIDYYNRFIATSPPEEQVSLAQQGIVAARIEMQRDAAAPKPVVRRREWYTSDTVLVVAGGAGVALGIAAFAYGNHLGNDQSESLAAYDSRADRARAYQYTGVGIALAGLVTAGVTVLRWRLRPDDGELRVTANGTGAAVSFTW